MSFSYLTDAGQSSAMPWEISAFQNFSFKYTFVRYSYNFNNIIMSPLFRIFLWLVFYVAVFVKALKNCSYWFHIKNYLITFIVFLFSFNTALDKFSPRDIELNPEAQRDINQCFSVRHWNLNRVWSQNFSKVQSIIANNYLYKFDIICLSESCLNFNILSKNSKLKILGYNFVRMYHPSNTKRGGVCINCKCLLPLKVIDVSYLQECINFEVKIGDKT